MFDVITIGTATRDVFLESHLFKVVKDPHFTQAAGFPEPEASCFALGAKLNVDEIYFTTGGGATNAAVTFSRQGLNSASLFKLGKDFRGEVVLKEVKKEGVLTMPIWDKKEQTAYSVILLTQGERTILTYRGASKDLKQNEVPFNKLKSKWVYLNPGSINFNVLKKIISHFYKSKAKIALNPSQAQLRLGLFRMKDILAKTSVLILNREEAGQLTNTDFNNERRILNILCSATPGIILITDGPRGAVICNHEFHYRAGIYPEKKLVDRTGSGDAFGSGFVASLIQSEKRGKIKLGKGLGLLIPQDEFIGAIKLASANATSVVEKVGAKAGILTRKEFESQPRWKKLVISKVKI